MPSSKLNRCLLPNASLAQWSQTSRSSGLATLSTTTTTTTTTRVPWDKKWAASYSSSAAPHLRLIVPPPPRHYYCYRHAGQQLYQHQQQQHRSLMIGSRIGTCSSTKSVTRSSQRGGHVFAIWSWSFLSFQSSAEVSGSIPGLGGGGQRRGFAENSKRDFYNVLGVDRKADKAAIKKAYFKLAKQYHPDTNRGDEKAADKFKEATAAYEVLSDDKQRELYDQFGHAGVDPNFQGGNPFDGMDINFGDGSTFHFSSTGGNENQIDAEEIFEMFFGGSGRRNGRRNRGPRRGQDIQMHVRISFREAVFGVAKKVKVRYEAIDPKAKQVVYKERDVNVDVPAGVDHGMNLRLPGEGAEGDPGAPRGNLLVQVIVDEDSYFERDGYDVHSKVEVGIVTAILGGTVDIRTLDGAVELKIPKGVQPNSKLMLRGKGIVELNGTRKGDHVVHIVIKIPKDITKRQEELIRQFDNPPDDDDDDGCKSTVDGIAKTAFEKLFGSRKKKKDNTTTTSDGQKVEKTSGKEEEKEEVDEPVEEKKTA